MVIVRLMGGLGNQMFQYAAARATSLRTGATLKVDLSWFTEEGRDALPQRTYELEVFGLGLDVASDAEIARLMRPAGLRRRPRVLTDPSLRFDRRVLRADDVRLIGYWQSEKYFSDQRAAILADFSFPAPSDPQNAELETAIAAVEAVSVHVRRGDYAEDTAVASAIGLLPQSYYRAAIERITRLVDQPHFFVFSDNPEWAAANLDLDRPHTFVSHNRGPQSFADMRLMTRCRHHVVANSSFSWWGAWLNDSRAKIVVAPQRWFRERRFDARDVLPDAWIAI